MYNIDCPVSQLCNRLTHSCENVCGKETCGQNAVCLADDHKALCQCPPGYKPNPLPEVECSLITGCTSGLCHRSAICEMTSNGPICKCPEHFEGNPYGEVIPFAQKTLYVKMDNVKMYAIATVVKILNVRLLMENPNVYVFPSLHPMEI
uniref:EGF-like domain-containing protein n=1 Tax=Megaselia scalaris TaxID=36166 RepID=T1GS29_MEGSC